MSITDRKHRLLLNRVNKAAVGRFNDLTCDPPGMPNTTETNWGGGGVGAQWLGWWSGVKVTTGA